MTHAFSGNPLNRSSGAPKSAEWYAGVIADPSARYLCFDEDQVLVSVGDSQSTELCLLSLAELAAHGLRVQASTTQHHAAIDGGTDGGPGDSVQPVVLGRRVEDRCPDIAATDAYVLAVDLSGLARFSPSTLIASVSPPGHKQYQRIRAVLSSLSPGDVAVAGHALALLSMHRQYKFCHCCGAATCVCVFLCLFSCCIECNDQFSTVMLDGGRSENTHTHKQTCVCMFVCIFTHHISVCICVHIHICTNIFTDRYRCRYRFRY